MKKIIFRISVCLSLIALTTIGVKITHNTSTIGLAFSNMEALASDAEGGGQGKGCSRGKQFTGNPSNTAYDCINPGRTICIRYTQYIQLGPNTGTCTNY